MADQSKFHLTYPEAKKAVLYIIRGMPGSGKSTYVKKRWPNVTLSHVAPKAPDMGPARGYDPISVSSDHFFTDVVTGEYSFDIKKLSQSHNWAKVQLIEAMQRGVMTIILDNTHSRLWEYEIAMRIAEALNYEVEVIDLFDGGCTDEELFERGIHPVPLEVIQSQRERWEHGSANLVTPDGQFHHKLRR